MKKIIGIRRFRFEKWACLSCCNNSNHAFPSAELIFDDSPWNSSRFFSPNVLCSYSCACTIHSNLSISRMNRDSAVLPSSYSSQAALIFVSRVGLIGFNKLWMYRVSKSSNLNLCFIIYQSMWDDLEEIHLPLVTPAYVGMSPTTDSAISWHSARNIHFPISKPSCSTSTSATLTEILDGSKRT